jgi:hypothetical protein
MNPLRNSPNPADRVRGLDQDIADAELQLTMRQSLRDTIAGELAARDPDRRESPSEEAGWNDLVLAIQQLTRGVSSVDGMANRLVEAQLRAPIMGIEHLERVLVHWKEQRATDAATDAAAFSGTRPYRRKHTPGKYIENGRVVKPGEVVMLTHQQAKAFADNFEPVTETETVQQ